MDRNIKKKKSKHGRAVLSNFQNKKAFSPLRKALLEQTVEKIVGKNPRQVPILEQKEKKKKKTSKNKNNKFSKGPSSNYMEFSVAVSAQPNNEFIQQCTSYLQERKCQLQEIYFTRKQLEQMTKSEEPSQYQPKQNFKFSPKTVTSSPIPDILESLRQTYKTPIKHKVSIESPSKTCPYCGRDFQTTNNIQKECSTLNVQNSLGIISPNLDFTYYPHKF
ncbi:hypothetical protein C0J52_12201 [Blattella germanica]|nr:hypothetical protein C0J52_12201 [Blattella germanica]